MEERSGTQVNALKEERKMKVERREEGRREGREEYRLVKLT